MAAAITPPNKLDKQIMDDIQIYGCVYNEKDNEKNAKGNIMKKNKNDFGDFTWMINNGYRDNTLYIFNDNTNHHNSNDKGAGNGQMRIYNSRKMQKNPSTKDNEPYIDVNDNNRDYSTNPLSAGISTGPLGSGFTTFDNTEKDIVNKEFNEIVDIIDKNKNYDSKKYKYIYYSVSQKKNTPSDIIYYELGVQIFASTINPAVCPYIDNLIRTLSSKPVIIYDMTE